MSNWKRKQQECSGTYRFSGTFYVTMGIQHLLKPDEILTIYLDAKKFAFEQGGIDYLLIYSNEDGVKLFFIDNVNTEMKAAPQFESQNDYCTLMLAEEY